jgi:hypothetical protein
MKYRQLSKDKDYLFGQPAKFLQDTPQTVAQAIETRLALYVGEWFLDTREGLDKSQILGNNTSETRDIEIQNRILQTPGVDSLASYDSEVEDRSFTVVATVITKYGAINFTKAF